MECQDRENEKKVYCYRCGKWLDHWHYVYVGGKMLPACPDDRQCKPDKSVRRDRRSSY